MTDQDTAAPEGTAGPRPELIHTGTYALWRTPEGGVHVVFRRTAATNPDTGQVTDIDTEGQGDEHLPDIPAEALPLVDQFLQHGIPPGILAAAQAMAGGASPLTLLRQLAASNGGEAADPAGEHVHVPGDGPCPACGWTGLGADADA